MISRRGITLIEVIIFLVMLGVIAAMSLPRFNDIERQNRVIAASTAVASDVEAAFSMAARERKPVRLTYNASSGELQFADRASGTVYRRRALRATSEYRLDSVTLAPSTTDFFPNGLASNALTVTLIDGRFVRLISVARTGLTRTVVP